MLIIEKLPTRYSEGSATVVANEVTVTPTDALWYGNVWGDDLFFDPAQPLVPPQRIASVNEDGTLTLAYPWPGDTMTEAPYEIRYIGIIERSTAQTRRVIEELGKISPYYDVQVDTLADRDDYDDRPTGFAVLVADTGDGRSAIYSKNSATSGDWSDPAYVTGPAVTLDVGSVTPVAFGNDPDVTLTPVAGGYEFDFELPENATFQSGTITTLNPGEDATFSLSPVAGGYALNLGVPRGPTGDIDGVTPFWQGRITVDTTLAQARAGLTPGERGVFTPPDFATADLTPAEVRTLIGNVSGFYKFATSNGNDIPLPPGFPQSRGAISGFVSPNSSYVYTWQILTGASVNRMWRRQAISATTWTPWAEFWHSENMPLASQVEVEAGTGTNARAMTPQRLAQAIAALAPEVPADVYKRSNILGTVSQSGGIPTGAIIERGSNANGEYVKFADGTMICTHEIATGAISATQGALYISSSLSWTFPSVFIAPPNISTSATRLSGAGLLVPGMIGNNNITTTGVPGNIYVGSTATGPTATLMLTATGRWF